MNKKKAYILLAFMFPNFSYADYTIGDGVELGKVLLSGYSEMAWESANGLPQSLAVDDFSLFASASINSYINPFIEVEIASATLWQEGKGIGFEGSRLVLERLYNDLHFTEAVNIRLGKSLAPVGEWNRIHAAPLVWTTNRPVTTRFSFSEFISGFNIQYTQQNNNIYQIYFQPGNEWISKQTIKNRPRKYNKVFGISFDKYFGLNNKLGFAVQHAQVQGNGDNQWVFSLDGQWQSKLIDLEFQSTYTVINFKHSTSQKVNEWGGYLQGVWHLNEQWHIILRPEYFETRSKASQSSMLYGLVYRPQPALSLKLEYMDINRRQSFGFSQGWFASLAVLF